MRHFNLFTDDLTTCLPEELEVALRTLAASNIEEKYRLDFKETWDPQARVKDIAAFANTFGGLLVLGISDDRQRFPGIEKPRNSDLKTQLASTISSRLSPPPRFEIHTCPATGSSTNSLVLIRIQSQPRMHFYLQGRQPVWIRTEDKSEPASAAELRALLDKVQNASSVGDSLIRPFESPCPTFAVTVGEPDAEGSNFLNPSNRLRSTTYLWTTLHPSDPLKLQLHRSTETSFRRLLGRFYPGMAQRLSNEIGTSMHFREDRHAHWYECVYLDSERDYEMRWLLTSAGTIYFTSQIASGFSRRACDLWSIKDLVVSLTATVRVADQFWREHHYYGDAEIWTQLELANLTPARDNDEYFPLFYDAVFHLPALAAIQTPGSYPIHSAQAHAELPFSSRNELLAQTVSDLANQLLRSCRYSVDLKEFEAGVEALLRNGRG